MMFFHDEKGQEIQDRGGSYYNEYEADVVCELVQMLLKNRVKGHMIGVIALCINKICLILCVYIVCR